MSWFETTLRYKNETATVRIDGNRVDVRLPNKKPSRWTYERLHEHAACVFEANVEALLAAGFAEVGNAGDDSVPGALAFFAQESLEELYWLRWDGERPVSVCTPGTSCW
jgi:hypothetical protein